MCAKVFAPLDHVDYPPSALTRNYSCFFFSHLTRFFNVRASFFVLLFFLSKYAPSCWYCLVPLEFVPYGICIFFLMVGCKTTPVAPQEIHCAQVVFVFDAKPLLLSRLPSLLRMPLVFSFWCKITAPVVVPAEFIFCHPRCCCFFCEQSVLVNSSARVMHTAWHPDPNARALLSLSTGSGQTGKHFSLHLHGGLRT